MPDELVQYLLSGGDHSSASLDSNTLKLMGKQAAARFLNGGELLTDAVAKLASETPGIQTEQVKRICEFANIEVNSHLFDKLAAEQQGGLVYTDFKPADPARVMQSLAGDAKLASFVVDAPEYDLSPEASLGCAIGGDELLAEMFLGGIFEKEAANDDPYKTNTRDQRILSGVGHGGAAGALLGGARGYYGAGGMYGGSKALLSTVKGAGKGALAGGALGGFAGSAIHGQADARRTAKAVNADLKKSKEYEKTAVAGAGAAVFSHPVRVRGTIGTVPMDDAGNKTGYVPSPAFLSEFVGNDKGRLVSIDSDREFPDIRDRIQETAEETGNDKMAEMNPWLKKGLIGAAGATGLAGAGAVGHHLGKKKGYKKGAEAGVREGWGRGFRTGGRFTLNEALRSGALDSERFTEHLRSRNSQARARRSTEKAASILDR